MRNILTILTVILLQSLTMSAQTDYTQIIGDDSTDFFSYGESSTRIGFRIGSGNIIETNQSTVSEKYNLIEIEISEKLLNGIDFTFGCGSLLSVGLSIIPVRDLFISPYGNFSIGSHGARMAVGVTIPLHFIKGNFDARYEKFVTGRPVNLIGYSAGINIEL